MREGAFQAWAGHRAPECSVAQGAPRIHLHMEKEVKEPIQLGGVLCRASIPLALPSSAWPDLCSLLPPCSSLSSGKTGRGNKETVVEKPALPRTRTALLCVVDTLQAWATMEAQKGDHAMAEDLYRAADKLDPGNPVMLNAWASFRKKSTGDSAGARQMYADAVSANPDDTRSLQASMKRIVSRQ